MFNDRFCSLIRSNRLLERNLTNFDAVVITNFEAYTFINDGILQMCDFQGLKKQTKFLVKKSLDTYALRFPQSTPDEISLAAAGFLLMAVKFNEDPILYEKITIKWVLNQLQSQDNPFELQDFLDFELKIYEMNEFGLEFTTPYDYLGLYTQIFSIDCKTSQKVKIILDFSFTIPELIFNSAEELFFGALLMVWRGKRKQMEWALNQTISKQNSLIASQVINQYYQRELQLAYSEGTQQ